jgi:hypothetical protein
VGCTKCNSLLFHGGNIDFSKSADNTAEGCQLCGLIFHKAKLSGVDGWNGQVYRTGSALMLQHSGHRILRLCSDLGSYPRLDGYLDMVY